METLQLIGVILAAVGAINWGLVALFKFDFLFICLAPGLGFHHAPGGARAPVTSPGPLGQ